jgi:hypothetical protein
VADEDELGHFGSGVPVGSVSNQQERAALALVGTIGKGLRNFRIASHASRRTRLRFAPPQVLAQLGREPLRALVLWGHILAGLFIHAKRLADIARPHQPLRSFGEAIAQQER